MASGMGVRGTIGRCYGFFADYKQCQTDTRAAIQNPTEENDKKVGGCLPMREDYFECLHGRKESARIKKVLAEKKNQEYEAKHGISLSHH